MPGRTETAPVATALAPGGATLTVAAAQYSSAGQVKTNQDSPLCDVLDGGRCALLAVADGMGSYTGGALASQLAVQRLAAIGASLEAMDDVAEARPLLEEVFRDAAADLNAQVRRNPNVSDMGSTMVCVAVVDGRYVVGNLGDSRAYLLRDGRLEQVSEDHSRLGEALKAGQRVDPYSQEGSLLARQLTRYLAAEVEPDPEFFPRNKPAFDARPGDILLLVCDGVHRFVPEELMKQVLQSAPSAEVAAKYLTDLALSRKSNDNVTAVVASFGAWPKSGRKMPGLGGGSAATANPAMKVLVPVMAGAGLLLVVSIGLAVSSMMNPGGAKPAISTNASDTPAGRGDEANESNTGGGGNVQIERFGVSGPTTSVPDRPTAVPSRPGRPGRPSRPTSGDSRPNRTQNVSRPSRTQHSAAPKTRPNSSGSSNPGGGRPNRSGGALGEDL